ncbi:MAG TPA: hypothetical protein VJV78_15875 [Polyangiales bacterium]|nr:hypothetical protein [Polyangiales bacterium]
MRAEQRWAGFAAGIGSRALRFLTTFLITTACIRVFGSATWGIVVIAVTTTELLLYADFATPDLCALEAARANDYQQLRARLGQALWLIIAPALLGALILLVAAELTPLWYGHAESERRTLSALLIACACGSPLVLVANCIGATLQGLGRLREMNSMHALSALIELGLVVSLLALGFDAVHVQWARTAGQGVRLVCMLVAFMRLGLALPVPLPPDRSVLREMASYCAELSVLKVIGNAIGRGTVPLGQRFTTTAIIGSYDVIDRLSSVLSRASNPVADSLFQRYVRAFDASATDAQRDAGRRDFLAGTLFVSGISACATLVTVNLSRWLFPLWLGPSLAHDPIAFAPWIMASWSLGMSVSMCGALLIALRRVRICNWVHVLALIVTVTTIVTLGLHARASALDGRYALLAGPLAGSIVIALGLGFFACRSTGVPLRQLGALVGAVWAPAWLALAATRLWPNPTVAALSTALGLLGIGLVAANNAAVRSLVREFRTSGEYPAVRPSTQPP